MSATPKNQDHHELIRQGYVADAMSQAAGLVAACDLPPDELRRRGRRGWDTALAHARAVSPWHAERMAGLDPGAGPADVPTMTKDDLVANFDRIVADRRCSLDRCEELLAAVEDRPCMDEDHLVLTSGGTSGRRAVFPWARSGAARIFLGAVRWALRGPLDGQPPRQVTSVGARSPRHATAAMSSIFGTPGDGTRFPVDLDVADIVAGLNRAEPDMLVVYASMVPILAEESIAGRLTIRPRVVSPTSEPSPPGSREAAAEAWGIELTEIYGTSEVGTVAAGCGAAPGMHVNEDLVLVETVDADGRPIAPGERSARTVVTALGAGHVLPLVRYVLDDEVVTLDEPCPCGSPFRRMAEVTGRADERLAWGGVSVHPHVIRSAFAAHAGVLEYQVRAVTDGVEVDVRPSGRVSIDVHGLRSDIYRTLSRAGLVGPRVDVAVVPGAPRTAAGKLRRFVPLGDGARTTAGTGTGTATDVTV
ncbi:MAG: phenylacetate--CoA ligase family protein [Acidimicrobiales bacterium]